MAQSLFRSIRMKLFNEGKLLRYLGYAVGEILLIITGILIAVQISNWNEDRKAQVEFDLYIAQLKEDVRTSISVADYRAERAEFRIQQALTVLDFLKGEFAEIELENLETALDGLGKYSITEIYYGNLSQLLEGNFDAISRDKKLTKHVLVMTREVKQRLGTITEGFELYKISLATFAKYMGRTNLLVPRVEFSYDLEEIKNSAEFSYATQNLMNYLAIANDRYTEINEELEKFLTVLEEYE